MIVILNHFQFQDGVNWGPNIQQYIDAGVTSSSVVVKDEGRENRRTSEQERMNEKGNGDDNVTVKKDWEGWAKKLFRFEECALDKYMCCLPEGLDWRDVHPIICLTRLRHFSNSNYFDTFQ